MEGRQKNRNRNPGKRKARSWKRRRTPEISHAASHRARRKKDIQN